MCHLAWLRAVPDDSKTSRLDKRLDDGISVDMPDIEGFDIIVEYLAELGYVNRGFNGAEPLTYTDVASWDNAIEGFVDRWVISMLVYLSRDYCYQASISSDKLCEPPYVMEVDDHDLQIIRDKTDEKIRRLFN